MEAPIRILIVDDNPDIVLLTRRTLAPAGYSLSEAGTGSDALKAV